jgi:hypothetical protein
MMMKKYLQVHDRQFPEGSACCGRLAVHESVLYNHRLGRRFVVFIRTVVCFFRGLANKHRREVGKDERLQKGY